MSFVNEPLAFVVSRKGRIIRYVPSKLFSESNLFIKVNEGVEFNTVADKLAKGHKQSDQVGTPLQQTPGW